MDYTARYGLEFNPFLKNSKEVLVETQESNLLNNTRSFLSSICHIYSYFQQPLDFIFFCRLILISEPHM